MGNNEKLYPDSSVEISGWLARYYEHFWNIVTFGWYGKFIGEVVRSMGIQPEDKILDLGAGNGYNACKMRKFLSEKGEILGLDIGEDMIRTFKKKCMKYSNVRVEKRRIDIPFEEELQNRFDRAFISFVMHGLPHESRLYVVKNAFSSLKDGGKFFILDYNEFELNEIPFYKRKVFEAIECPYAFDFIKRDWEKILSEAGFKNFEKKKFLLNMVRLLIAEK